MPFLNFKGKTTVETYHHALPHHTLEFVSDLSVLGEEQEPALDGNLIIEGDNLLALKAILPTHSGRIKCAFLDPPYNTGNEEWVYNDNLTQPQFKEWIGRTVGKEADDACRHDKWCCMMYPRLMLVKELMKDDGLVFITIDDSEVANLRLMMDEVFGPENFIVNAIWQKADSPSSNVKDIKFTQYHDHVLIYARDINKVKVAWQDDPDILLAYNRREPDGHRYRLRLMRKNGKAARRKDRETMWYKATDPDGNEVWPISPEGWEGRWAIGEDEYKQREAEGRIVWEIPRGGTRLVPYTYERAPDVPKTPYPSIWADVQQSRQAKATLTALLGRDVEFDTPKPVELVKRAINIVTGPDDIVLDSFAGSGTTGQAVVAANAEDSGQRRFVLIQQPYDNKSYEEKGINICREITAERMRRLMCGYEFQGNKTEVLMQGRVTLDTLAGKDDLLDRMEDAKAQGAERGFDKIQTQCVNGVVRVLGQTVVTEKVEGTGGTFTYAKVSDAPLFGEFKDLGDRLPAYEELARYIYFTETSRQWSANGLTPETGRIGEHAGVSYYLLYRPNQEEDWGMDLSFLKVAESDSNKSIVVYCEMLRVHRDDLRRWQAETGKTVRSMIVPYNLK